MMFLSAFDTRPSSLIISADMNLPLVAVIAYIYRPFRDKTASSYFRAQAMPFMIEDI